MVCDASGHVFHAEGSRLRRQHCACTLLRRRSVSLGFDLAGGCTEPKTGAPTTTAQPRQSRAFRRKMKATAAASATMDAAQTCSRCSLMMRADRLQLTAIATQKDRITAPHTRVQGREQQLNQRDPVTIIPMTTCCAAVAKHWKEHMTCRCRSRSNAHIVQHKRGPRDVARLVSR